MSPLRINVWSSPRNISTAFMYSFAQRSDTTVVDEPLYAHYLANTESTVVHPGREEILAKMETDGNKVIKEVILGEYNTPVVLFKQMTHHLVNLDLEFIFQTKNILLIRDPREMIASYSKVIPNPGMKDIGIKAQYELYQMLFKGGKVAAVIDAKELLIDPRYVLIKLCAKLDIPFQENMLYWEAGPRAEDGIWADHWYENVHNSTGFKKYKSKKIELSRPLEALADECQDYYEFLFDNSLRSMRIVAKS